MAGAGRLPGLSRDPRTGIWRVRVKVKDADGEWRLVERSTGERDAKEAETKALRIRAEILEAPPPPRGEEQKRNRGVTLERMAAHDLVEHKNRGVTEAHRKALESKWNVILSVADPETPVADIDYDWLRSFEGMRRAGEKTLDAQGNEVWLRKPVKGQTLVREFQAIRRALVIAKRKGHIAELPDEWPTVRRDSPDERKSGKLRPPSVVAVYLGRLHQDARDEVEVDMLTGLRAAELKRLEPSWIEPAPRGSIVPAIIRVPRWAAKSRRERVVGCPKRALDIIKRRIPAAEKEAKKRGGPVRVFSQSDFKKHRARVWRDTAQELGLDPEVNLTLRDLRHTYATLALQSAADPAAVLAALGHKDLGMTQRYLTSPLERTAQLGAGVEGLYASADGMSTNGMSKKPRKGRKKNES